MSQRNIIYTIRFTEKEWKRLEQKIRENDEWKFKYGTKEGRVVLPIQLPTILMEQKESMHMRFLKQH